MKTKIFRHYYNNISYHYISSFRTKITLLFFKYIHNAILSLPTFYVKQSNRIRVVAEKIHYDLLQHLLYYQSPDLNYANRHFIINDKLIKKGYEIKEIERAKFDLLECAYIGESKHPSLLFITKDGERFFYINGSNFIQRKKMWNKLILFFKRCKFLIWKKLYEKIFL